MTTAAAKAEALLRVFVMYGRAVVSGTSLFLHGVIFSTTEAECVPMAGGAEECMFVKVILSFLSCVEKCDGLRYRSSREHRGSQGLG